jgi:hypothetical protein
MKYKFQIEHNIHRAVQSCVAEDTNTTVPDSLQSKGKTNKVIFVLFAQKNMFACIVSKKKRKKLNHCGAFVNKGQRYGVEPIKNGWMHEITEPHFTCRHIFLVYVG